MSLLSKLSRADCLGVVSNPLYADNCRTGATGKAIYKARERYDTSFAGFCFLCTFKECRMNQYEYYINEQQLCQELAKLYSAADDFKLCVFYMNAAEGFRIKAEKLNVKSVTR